MSDQLEWRAVLRDHILNPRKYSLPPDAIVIHGTQMKITQDLVDRTQALLSDFNDLLDHNPEVDGELRVKLAKAELCLFKIASIMQAQVDKQN